MINLISIFTRGGAVLWSKEISPLKGNPINDLIQNVILEDRGGQQTMEHGSFTLKWTFANQLELVFVAVYLNLTRLLYVDELLTRVKEEFSNVFKGQLVPGQPIIPQNFYSFGSHFEEILNEFETRYSKKKSRPNKPRGFYNTAKGKEYQQPDTKGKKKPSANGTSGDATVKKDEKVLTPKGSDDSGSGEEDPPVLPGAPASLDERLKHLGMRGKKGKKPGGYKPKKKKGGKAKEPKKVKKREWEPKTSAEEARKLDLAGTSTNGDGNEIGNDDQRDKFFKRNVDENGEPLAPDLDESESEGELSEEYDSEEEEKEASDTSGGGIFGYFSALKDKVNFNKPLTDEDLQPIVAQVEDDLIKKNVAAEICKKLCASVQASLVGKKLGTFTRIKPVVKKTLEEALLRIVTPKKQVDLLHGVASAREQGRPYTVVFVGVNGVGKSTSLAKIAHYLTSRNLTVSIAACDTFRSGAVEQLQTHARYLGVRLYHKGYAKDPSAVAMDAIKEGKKLKDDVVLIDTAGRMQDNEPLMRSLSKLVIQNKPDLILFVGEALVGNDAVDQLTKFNRALTDLSAERVPRLIDGIVLTKFDTVDDKVGAAISMTYTTGSPIVFIGTGQTYADLKRVHAKTIIRMLLR